jgi:hypothetical protein
MHSTLRAAGVGFLTGMVLVMLMLTALTLSGVQAPSA